MRPNLAHSAKPVDRDDIVLRKVLGSLPEFLGVVEYVKFALVVGFAILVTGMPVSITKKQLAGLLGISEKSVDRLLNDLKANAGVKFKGQGKMSTYDLLDFFEKWLKWDTRK